VRALTWGGDGSPGSREAEGEGGERFYIAQSGRRADLCVSLWGLRGPEAGCGGDLGRLVKFDCKNRIEGLD
jgi:hypothetical protein